MNKPIKALCKPGLASKTNKVEIAQKPDEKKPNDVIFFFNINKKLFEKFRI